MSRCSAARSVFESYAPRIRCPVLHRRATNDFHGWMNDVCRTNALLPDQPVRYSRTPHMNHTVLLFTALVLALAGGYFAGVSNVFFSHANTPNIIA